MPFASNKTQEQLSLESKTKSKDMILKAVKLLEKVSRKRDTHPDVKKHLKELCEDDLKHLAEAVGPPK